MKKYLYWCLLFLAVLSIFMYLYLPKSEQVNTKSHTNDLAENSPKLTQTEKAHFPDDTLTRFSDVEEACDFDKTTLTLSDAEVREKYQSLKSLVSTYALSGQDELLAIQLAALKTGLGLSFPRDIIKYEEIESSIDVSLTETNAQVNNMLQTIIDQGDIDRIIERLKTGDLSFTKHYLTTYASTRLTGLLIERFDGIQVDKLHMLIELGLSVDHDDLLLATIKAWDKETIQQLFSHSSVNPEQAFLYQGRFHTYFSVAIASGSFENVMFWRGITSDLLADIFTQETYHIFIAGTSKYKFEEQKAIAKMLLSSKLLDRHKKALVASYPSLEYDQKEVSVTNVDDYLAPSTLSDAQLYINKILQESLYGIEKSDLIIRDNDCYQEFGKHVNRFIVNRHQQLRLASERGLDANLLESWLIKEKRLQSSTELQKKEEAEKDFYNKRFEQTMLTAKAEQENLPTDEEMAAVESASAAAELRDWKTAFEIIKELTNSRQIAEEFILSEALLMNPVPLNVLKQYSKNAQFPGDTLHTLIVNDDPDTLRYILQLGNDFNSLYSESSLDWMLKRVVRESAFEMLNLMLDHGVPIAQGTGRTDVLDTALIAIKRDSSMPLTSIGILLDHGATIEDSHLQALMELRQSDQDAFNAIITTYPIFAQ